jgi:hypothetical protein
VRSFVRAWRPFASSAAATRAARVRYYCSLEDIIGSSSAVVNVREMTSVA